MSRELIIDPPSGWMYGFPKVLPEEVQRKGTLKEWLLDNGYPKKDIKLALKYSRYWTQETEGDKDNE